MLHGSRRRLSPVAILFTLCAAAFGADAPAAPASAAPSTQPLVDFAKDVQPILSEN